MVALPAIFFTVCFHQIFWNPGSSSHITVERCPPPDYPESGGYGPEKEHYLPGDIIHYYCNPGHYIGGNYLRICVDSGDWSGDTPVCDAAAIFARVEQSSTAQPDYPNVANDADRASDDDRSTCSKTLGEENGATWTGILQKRAREAIRFMLFLPQGDVAYEVFILRSDGSQVSCGSSRKNVVMYEWAFHNCPQPKNTDVISVMVKSLTNQPLELCEVVVHTLTDPTCVDPHFQVDNGRLILTRKTASLRCNEGYSRWDGSPSKLDCIRTGVWSRRSLYCEENKNVLIQEGEGDWSVEGRPSSSNERLIKRRNRGRT